MLNLLTLDMSKKVKALELDAVKQIFTGRDNLDQISEQIYGSTSYWMYLAVYNDIINPFNLVSQGVVTIKLFSKTKIDNLISS